MEDDEGSLSFGAAHSETVSEVENQMGVGNESAVVANDVGLDLPDLMLEESQSRCCQLASRLASSNATGVCDLLDVVLRNSVSVCILYDFWTMSSTPPRYTLLGIPQTTRKHIFFWNKHILLIREYYINVNTQRIVSTTVWTLRVKKLQ